MLGIISGVIVVLRLCFPTGMLVLWIYYSVSLFAEEGPNGAMPGLLVDNRQASRDEEHQRNWSYGSKLSTIEVKSRESQHSSSSSHRSLSTVKDSSGVSPDAQHGSTYRVAQLGIYSFTNDSSCPLELDIKIHGNTIYPDRMSEASFQRWMDLQSTRTLRKIATQLEASKSALEIFGFRDSTIYQRTFYIHNDVVQRMQTTSKLTMARRVVNSIARTVKKLRSERPPKPLLTDSTIDSIN